jgi:hypothetical protein
MRCIVQYPAAARPYPGEVPMPVHEAGVGVPDPGWRADPVPDSTQAPVPGPEFDVSREGFAALTPDIDRGAAAVPADGGKCTELTKAGQPCKGRPGPDRRCAAHKQS